MVKTMNGTLAPELKAYYARTAKSAKDKAVRLSGENLRARAGKRPPGA
jgi:hypothetical protein